MAANLPPQRSLLCEWQRSTSDCREFEFVKWTLIVGAVLHLLVGIYGLWVMRYRNGGFKRTIVTDLYSVEGSGIRPKPIDCFILFETVACFLKSSSHYILLIDNSLTPLWFRIAVDQLYWWLAFIVTPAFYLVGISYVIPVTEFEGKFAIYRTPATHGQRQSEIRVFYPPYHQRNLFLVFGVVFPGLCCASFGIASGVLVDQGHADLAETLRLVQNTNWVFVYWLMGCILLYYGVMFTLILRAHIITTEARRGLPLAAFGLGNLKSRSPARYLFIVLQLTAFAAGLILLWSGLMNGLQTWDKRNLLKSEDVRWYRNLVFMWSIPVTIAYFVKFTLVAVHCSRNKEQKLVSTSGQSTVPLNGGAQSMELLTLNLHPNFSSFSETTQALEKGLYELVTMHLPNDKPREEPMHDGGRDAGNKIEDVNDWSAPLAIDLGPVIEVPLFSSASVNMADRELTSTTLMASAFSKRSFPPHPSNFSTSRMSSDGDQCIMQDLKRLQLQHESAMERLQTLHTLQQKHQLSPQKEQQLQAIQKQGWNTDVMLERLEVLLEQHQQSQRNRLQGGSHCNSQGKTDPGDIHIRSEIQLLLHHLKTSLRQLTRLIDLYQSGPHHPTTAEHL